MQHGIRELGPVLGDDSSMGTELSAGWGAPDVVHHLEAGVDLQRAGRQVAEEPGVLHDALDAEAARRICHQQPLQQMLAFL